MGDTKVSSAVASDLKSAFTDFSVASQSTDAATGDKETIWQDNLWGRYLGYYKDEKTPELTAVIDAKATWTVGKGFKADEITTMILDTIKGNGQDTFNTILENAMRVLLLGGNFYAEIINDDEDNLINLKPLDPGVMSNVSNSKGVIFAFEQASKVEGKAPKRFPAEKIFYLARNRIADELHGTGIAQKLKLIIDMKNEAMEDMRTLMHWHVKPRWKHRIKDDDPATIAAYKTKQDAAKAAGEDIYEPFDIVESELIAVPPNATLNPMTWINYLDNLFYQVAGVPKIVVGGSSEFTEKASSIVYLAFQQSVEEEQLFIEEQVLSQLNLVINLEFPVSLENELLSDKKKDGAENVQPNETTAGAGQ